MNGFRQDIRFGLRALARNMRTTLISVISLALGIGAVTSIYCTVSAVLMNPVPFPESDRIVHLFDTVQGRGDDFTSSGYMDFRDYDAGLKEQFDSLGAFSQEEVNFTGPDGPERLHAMAVSSGFFPMLRVSMLHGRGISPAADDLDAPREAVISEALWRRAFQARADIVGQSVMLDGTPHAVVGVVPESFRFVMSGPADVWVSMGIYKAQAKERGNHWLIVWGRLRDGVSWAQAEQAYAQVVARLAEQYPDTNKGRMGQLRRPSELMLREFRPMLIMLVGAVGFVLLIACVNVASLLLANAAGRRKEIAIRAALGATRGRILRQLLTESVILAIIGGALGVLVSLWGNSLINQLLPAEDRDFYVKYFEFGIRPGVLVFALGISVLTGILFGIMPALEASRLELAETLKEGGRGGGGGLRRHRLLTSLVVGEVALALVLLAGAGLLIQSLRNVYKADPGFDAKELLTFYVGLPQGVERKPMEALHFFETAQERMLQSGGVSAVGAATGIPFSNYDSSTWVFVEGRPETTPDKRLIAGFRVVTPEYMNALGVPVVAGRDLTRQDRLDPAYWDQVEALSKSTESEKKWETLPEVERPVLVNEAMAKSFWPGEDALGKRFRQGSAESRGWLRIVGIVKDFYHRDFTPPVQPEMYIPIATMPVRSLFFVVRAKASAAALVPDMRRIVADIDPNQAIGEVATMQENIENENWFFGFVAGILSSFAVIALLLAAVGVYGVINCSVSQRTHEIGVRMALGATPGHVQRMIVINGMKLALAGGLIGIAGAFGLARLLQDMLYGVSAADPVTFVAVSVILLLVAAAASWLPARKATKVNPVEALRYE